MTDRELLGQYASTKSEEAFAEILRRHSAMVYSACMRILGDAGAAADATQVTFVVFARKARDIPGAATLSGWLFLTARNSAQKLGRAEARRAKHEQGAAMERMRLRPQEAVSWEHVGPELNAAIASLPRRQRDAIVLRYLEGRTENEVAAEVGCSRSTVATQLSRAVHRLREKLRRRGVTVPAAVLMGFLSEQSVEVVPAGLPASIREVCLGKAVASARVLSTAEAVMKTLMWAKVRSAAAIVCVAVLLGTGGAVAVRELVAGEAEKMPAPSPDKEGFLPARVLLIGSGVSPKFKNPEVTKIEAKYKAKGKPSPFPRKYAHARPEFCYFPHRSWPAAEVFEKNIEFMAKEIVPYCPGDVYAGIAEMKGGISHGKGLIWRPEEGPKNLHMANFMNIHSMRRQAKFLADRGIKMGFHMGLNTVLLHQLPADAMKTGMARGKPGKPGSGGIRKLPAGFQMIGLNSRNADAVKWMEDTWELWADIGLRYCWHDWGNRSAFVAAARRGAARKGKTVVMRSGAGGGCGNEELDILAPSPDLGPRWHSYEKRFHWWFPSVFPKLFENVCRMGVDDFYINQGNTLDQARFICSMWALGGSGITWTEQDFFKTPLRKMRVVQRILPLPEVEPLKFEPQGIMNAWETSLRGDAKRFRDRAASPEEAKTKLQTLQKNMAVTPRAWAMFLSRPFEKWHVVGFFNPRYYGVEKRVFDLKALQVKEADYAGWDSWKGEYLAWDFWDQRFLGVFSKKMKLRLGPSSCLVAALRRRTGAPQLLSTDRHITQGGDEIEDCKWSEKDGKLSGSFKRGVKGRSFSLFVYVPANYQYQSSGGDVEQVKKHAGPVLRVQLKPQVKAKFELVFKKTGAETPKAKPADSTLVQNGAAELIPGDSLVLKELLFKKGGRKSGFEKEAYGSPGWEKLPDLPLWVKLSKAENSGLIWAMAKVTIPESWKGHDAHIYFARWTGAGSYLNGKRLRRHKLDPAAIKYGAENTLLIFGTRMALRHVGLKIDRRSSVRPSGK